MSKSQKTIYEPARLWLEEKGFKAIITGDKKEFVISVRDLQKNNVSEKNRKVV